MMLLSHDELAWGGESFECPAPDETLPSRFKQVARRFDTKAALASSTWQPSYGELDASSDRRSMAVVARGIVPGDRIAILMRHDSPQIDAVLAALKAGGIVVVLNPTDPAARLRLTLEDAAASLLIADATHRSLASKVAGPCACVGYDDLAAAAAGPLPRFDADTTAFIVYTSGSAGRPKGVMMNHQHVMHNALRLSFAMGLSADDRVALLASLGGLHGVTNLWCALLHGALLQPFPVMERGVTGLADWMMENRTTAFSASTSLFRSLMKSMPVGQLFESVRAVRIGGELVNSTDFRAFQRHFLPRASLVNTLASSEAGNISCLRISGTDILAEGAMVVGRALPGIEIELKDDDGVPVAAGEAGQIIVKSRYLSQGYWRNEALTAERFFRDGDGTPAIRSGDWGRIDQNGELEFLGRRDTLVKIHGSSVELDEVERALSRLADVERAVVCAFDGSYGAQLAAFVLPKEGRELSSPRLRRAARSLLPEFMIPAVFQIMHDLPLMAHGKVDRRKLVQTLRPATRQPIACETETETQIAAIWTDVFDLAEVSRNDDFYELGGDSLIASVIAARVYSETGVELDLKTFVDHPSVADLAHFVDRNRGRRNEYRVPVRAADGETKFPVSFAQQRIWDFCRTNSAGYVLSAVYKILGRLDGEALRACVNRLAARHEILRTTFEEGDNGPLQVVHPLGETPLPFHDLSEAVDPAAEMRELKAKYASQSFDLQRGPLLRFALVKTGANEHRLVRVIHHIIYDASSWKIYMDELAELYAAAMRGEEPPDRDEARPQYADYASWQRLSFHADAPACANMISWWRRELDQPAAPLDWPATRFLPPAHVDPSEGQFGCGIEETAWQRMADIAIEQKVTPFVVWLAAFSAFLCAETRTNDIVIGTYTSNRKRPELQRALGDFSNLVTLRFRDAAGKGFRGWISATRDVLTSATAHSEVPYEELRRSFATVGMALPEIRTIFLLGPAERPLEFAGLTVAREDPPSLPSMPWGFTFVLVPSKRLCKFAFDASLYDPVAVRAAGGRWQRFISQLACCPDAPRER